MPKKENDEQEYVAVKLKAGEKVETDSMCFDAESFRLIRFELMDCEQLRIEHEELLIFTRQLMETKLDHKPIWQQWFIKMPVAIGVGALAGWAMGKSTDDPWVAGLVGGLASGVTLTIFEISW